MHGRLPTSKRAIHFGKRTDMFDDNIEVIPMNVRSYRIGAWRRFKKVIDRADGSVVLPKGWPDDYDNPWNAGQGAKYTQRGC